MSACHTGTAFDDPPTLLVKRCLSTLEATFSDGRVMVDAANYTAGRDWKLSCTMARRGVHTPVPRIAGTRYFQYLVQ